MEDCFGSGIREQSLGLGASNGIHSTFAMRWRLPFPRYVFFAFGPKRRDGGRKDAACKSSRLALGFVAVPDVYFQACHFFRDTRTRHERKRTFSAFFFCTFCALPMSRPGAAGPAAGTNARLRTSRGLQTSKGGGSQTLRIRVGPASTPRDRAGYAVEGQTCLEGTRTRTNSGFGSTARASSRKGG